VTTWIDIVQAVTTGGAATAVIVVVRMFLAHLRDDRDDRIVARDAFLNVISNHLAHQTEAIEHLAAAVTELNARLNAGQVIDRTVVGKGV
jgi:hypothetical protein